MLHMGKVVLPDTQRLEALRKEGLTYKQIAEWVENKTGQRVSPASVGAALSRAGKTKARPRYDKHLPWVVRAEHMHHYAARMLRLMGRRDNGLKLSAEDNRRLDSWLSSLEEEAAVVVYAPDSEDGFYYVDGRPTADGIPILPPRAPGHRASA